MEKNVHGMRQAMAKFQRHPSDTGSSEVQVAILTERIQYMTKHVQVSLLHVYLITHKYSAVRVGALHDEAQLKTKRAMGRFTGKITILAGGSCRWCRTAASTSNTSRYKKTNAGEFLLLDLKHKIFTENVLYTKLKCIIYEPHGFERVDKSVLSCECLFPWV